MLKTPHVRAVWTLRRRFDILRGRRSGFCTMSKVTQREGFWGIFKMMAGVGHWKRIWKAAFFVAGALQEASQQRCSEVKEQIS